MEGGDLEFYVKRNYIPFYGLALSNLVDVDHVKSWVGNFKEMKERFSFEIILHFYSEWILMKNTVST